MVLEEVEMPPSELGEVMRLAWFPAVGAREQRAAIGGKFDAQFVGALVGVEPLANQLPRGRYPQTEGKHILGVHRQCLRCRLPDPEGYAIRPSETQWIPLGTSRSLKGVF